MGLSAERPAGQLAREGWLARALSLLRPRFARLGHPLPRSIRLRSLPLPDLEGCYVRWPAHVHWVLISSRYRSPFRLLDTLIHELAHAVVEGHHTPEHTALVAQVGTPPALARLAKRLGPAPRTGASKS